LVRGLIDRTGTVLLHCGMVEELKILPQVQEPALSGEPTNNAVLRIRDIFWIPDLILFYKKKIDFVLHLFI
jgi:hypothetical protein